MTYYESVKENAEEYLKHVPSQGITHKYEYTNILIGTTIMQLLSVIADELHEMNKRSGGKAEPVRHGHWIINGEWCTCSECKQSIHYERSKGKPNLINALSMAVNFCPFCGAKMDGEHEAD